MLQLLHYIIVRAVLRLSLQCYSATFIIVGAMLQLLLYIVLGAVLHLSLSADICFAATLHCIVDVGGLQMGMMSIIQTR